MPATATAIYAALLALLFVVLSVRVVSRRRSAGVTIGVAGDAELERAVRVHANFAEYAPYALLLMLLIELSGYTLWVVHALGVLLVAGRLVHAYGVSRSPEDYRFRVTGMALTFAVLGAAALLLLLDELLGRPLWPRG